MHMAYSSTNLRGLTFRLEHNIDVACESVVCVKVGCHGGNNGHSNETSVCVIGGKFLDGHN